MIITGFYAGLAALWLVFLFLYVVRGRFQYRVGLGDGGEKEMMKRIRIHANFIETVPFALILMGILETSNHSIYLLHALGIALLLSRILHFSGLQKNSGSSALRMGGSILVLLIFIIGAVLLISTFIQSILI